MSYKTILTSTFEEITTMQKNYYIKTTCSILKTVVYLAPILLCSIDAAAFDLDAGVKAGIDPVKKMINDYYPAAIFITGGMGAMMQQQGDLKERMLGFGKGALVGGLVVVAVKTGLGV